jgi:Flp pilus assembly pilin Flp
MRTTDRRGYRPASFVSESVLGSPMQVRRRCRLLYSGFATFGRWGFAKAAPPPFHLKGAEKECEMSRKIAEIRRFLADDSGGEVLEYAVVSGLIVMAAISLIGKVGSKVLARWNSLNSSL